MEYKVKSFYYLAIVVKFVKEEDNGWYHDRANPPADGGLHRAANLPPEHIAESGWLLFLPFWVRTGCVKTQIYVYGSMTFLCPLPPSQPSIRSSSIPIFRCCAPCPLYPPMIRDCSFSPFASSAGAIDRSATARKDASRRRCSSGTSLYRGRQDALVSLALGPMGPTSIRQPFEIHLRFRTV